MRGRSSFATKLRVVSVNEKRKPWGPTLEPTAIERDWQSAAERLSGARQEVADILGVPLEHRLADRIAGIIERETAYVRSSYESYTDHLADKANGWAVQ